MKRQDDLTMPLHLNYDLRISMLLAGMEVTAMPDGNYPKRYAGECWGGFESCWIEVPDVQYGFYFLGRILLAILTFGVSEILLRGRSHRGWEESRRPFRIRHAFPAP